MKLRYGLIFSIAGTVCIVIGQILTSLPDGKLHIVHCDIGQGDATYIRFPNGADMLVDGGPSGNRVIACLSEFMPFWDRYINIIVLTHPQRDHMDGLMEVMNRYGIGLVVRSDVANTTEGYAEFVSLIEQQSVPNQYVSAGDEMTVGNATVHIFGPRTEMMRQAAMMHATATTRSDVLGVVDDLNEYSVGLLVSYGMFDGVFPGDATLDAETIHALPTPNDGAFELLKVPHHGSSSGLDVSTLSRVAPEVAVISVGSNSYGHPAVEVLSILDRHGSSVKRTDVDGHVHIVSDGMSWWID